MTTFFARISQTIQSSIDSALLPVVAAPTSGPEEAKISSDDVSESTTDASEIVPPTSTLPVDHSELLTTTIVDSPGLIEAEPAKPVSFPHLAALDGVSQPASNPATQAAGETGRRRRRRGVDSTFVIVRPPPTSGSKRLLNLQIQMVLDVEGDGVRERRKSLKERSASTASVTTIGTLPALESPHLPSAPPSPSILTNPSSKSYLIKEGETSSPPRSLPSDKTGDSPARKTSITIAEPRSTGRSGSRTASPTGTEEVGDDTLTPHTNEIHSSDSEKNRIKAIRRNSRASSVASQTSVVSNVSAISGVSGISGISGISSTGGRGRKGKRIIPVYNLNVHNVMTTSVMNAGTDEKIAKFLKRGVEVHGVGSLEPSEIWHPYALDHRLAHLTPHQTRSDTGSPEKEEPPVLGAPVRKDGPVIQTGRTGKQEESPGGKTKMFFGKLFKKKEPGTIPENKAKVTGPLGPHTVPDGCISPARTSFVGNSAERLLLPLSPTATRMNNHNQPGHHQAYANHTFGLYPSVSSSANERLGEASLTRPMGYSFTIKRWASEKGGGPEGGVMTGWAARFAPQDQRGPGMGFGGEGEVVFEWARGKGKAGRMTRTVGELNAGQQRHSIVPLPVRNGSATNGDLFRSLHADMLEVPSSDSSRPTSMISLPERAASPCLSLKGSFLGDRWKDHDDEESDPEDSETPWVCRVYVPGQERKRPTLLNPNASPGRPSGNRSPTRKNSRDNGIVVATLYPAPHHPRVIAQIKISTEFEPIETGLRAAMRTKEGEMEQVLLTEENVKDVVGVTALWLVAREDFGGYNKKKVGAGK